MSLCLIWFCGWVSEWRGIGWFLHFEFVHRDIPRDGECVTETRNLWKHAFRHTDQYLTCFCYNLLVLFRIIILRFLPSCRAVSNARLPVYRWGKYFAKARNATDVRRVSCYERLLVRAHTNTQNGAEAVGSLTFRWGENLSGNNQPTHCRAAAVGVNEVIVVQWKRSSFRCDLLTQFGKDMA